MATYLQGIEDGRRDILVRIEREAVATFRDQLNEGPGPLKKELRLKVTVLVNLIRHLQAEPASFLTIYERIESEALRQIERERERSEARLADAKAMQS
jgi:hypothetical protein